MLGVAQFGEFVKDAADDGNLRRGALDERDTLVLDSLPLTRRQRVDWLALFVEQEPF